VNAFIFKGYWEDIGTIRAFYEANLDLTNLEPQYSFFEANAPIYTHPRFLPGSKINGATLRQAIISDGCMISDAHIERQCHRRPQHHPEWRDHSKQRDYGRRSL
jgi:glucose-1-phosphate adenylyltransferase